MAQGLRLDPTDAAGLTQMGIAHWSSGDLERARHFLQRSYDLGFAPVAGWLASLLAQQGKAQEAREIWRAFGSAAPGRYVPELESPEAWDDLGAALLTNDAVTLGRVAQPLADYLAQPGARANTYRLLMLVAAGHPADAMRLFVENPYPINAAFVYPIWIDGGGFTELRRHPDFPAFAERIGLVDAWNAHGWPARCEQLPQLEEDSPAFRCD
ncbi:MAG: hypothetical protein RIB46_10230 [Pseudomonadales bacterium]